jgi:superfamily I DNA/RNA helicase
MTIKKLQVGSKDYLEWIGSFLNSAGYQDWMLFMHSSQQKVVDNDFDGSAKLSGVSGSGKTCVVVNRAIRLAMKGPDKPVLILTLNKSLAALINELLDFACSNENIREKIISKSFFELCQDYLFTYEPQNKNLYNDVTWKNNEHIDEVWREFYRCELHDKSAEVLLPIHKSLNSQGISPEDYIRQEFDWVRSAFAEKERSKYLEVERRGRAIPFQENQRRIILEGLQGWEQKMAFVGVIDYLGLSTNLCRHIDKLTPDYSSVLVDEAQDFGTVEFKIIRKIVDEGSNDIFLAGDMAQHVLPKHQVLKDAEINIPGARSLSIKRNYRNSREILRAAYEIFISTMSEGDILFDGEIDILDPEYANFSSPKPLVLHAESLEDEITFAINYVNDELRNNPEMKACIAIAGFSLFEIKLYSDNCNLSVLDGTMGLQDKPFFLSDLEQTKGYEFDTVFILNCRNGILPPIEMPKEEQFRDACRFYVAMTRAKKELILTYTGEMSEWISNEKNRPYFDFDEITEFANIRSLKKCGIPEKMPQAHEQNSTSTLDLPGRSFLYTSHSIGMSLELQDKIDQLIDGTGLRRDGKRFKWASIGRALDDVKKHPYAKNLFGGQKTWKEFVSKVEDDIICKQG